MEKLYVEDGCPKCGSMLDYIGQEGEYEYGGYNFEIWECTNKNCEAKYKVDPVSVVAEEL